MEEFLERHPWLRRGIPYFIIGGGSTGVELIIFFIAKYNGFDIYQANIIGKLCGLTLSFILNTVINFKVKSNIVLRLIMFYAVGAGGLALSNLMLYGGVEVLGMPFGLVKFISVPVVGFCQFWINKIVTFRKKEIAEKLHMEEFVEEENQHEEEIHQDEKTRYEEEMELLDK
ncbi:MAG: GtrA family protein [Firmicutes bacterium]|nr:GtrA family protein [Bacillota bacterium]